MCALGFISNHADYKTPKKQRRVCAENSDRLQEGDKKQKQQKQQKKQKKQKQQDKQKQQEQQREPEWIQNALLHLKEMDRMDRMDREVAMNQKRETTSERTDQIQSP